MMLNWAMLLEKYGLRDKVTGVIHAGARLGEEAADYAAADISNVWWIEANPAVFLKLNAHVSALGHHAISALLAERPNEKMTFHVTNYDGMSSSVLEFGTHPEFSPDTVFVHDVELVTDTIDRLVDDFAISNVNMLVMDLQGFEGPVLRGARELLPHLDFVMSEVNKAQVYVGATQVEELDELLADFDRVETLWVADQGWGDAFWVRRS
jgi:FkbM family methyltransferase